MSEGLARSTADSEGWVDETALDEAPAVEWLTAEPRRTDTAGSGDAGRADSSAGALVGETERVRRVVARPTLPAPRERFELLQQFEGTVLATGPHEFQARLRDLTASGPTETATFDVNDISDDDRDLLRPGAVFYWSLGYRILRTGQKERTAAVRFRRLPMWSRSDLSHVQDLADRWAKMFGDDDAG